MRVPFARPTYQESDLEAVGRVLKSRWLTSGPEAEAFEQDIGALLGVDDVAVVSSCSAGLHLALLALDIGPGDEVILPPLTFVSTAHAIRHAGARPVFCDVEPDTLNLNPDAVARAVTSRTRAIIAVHYAGRACDMERLGKIAREHRLAIVSDAAHAFGTQWRGAPLEGSADLTVYSFYSTKTITSAEGGAVTGDATLVDRIRCLRNNGLSIDAHRRDVLGAYDVTEVGFKYTLPDVLAALGRAQIARARRHIEARNAVFAKYGAMLRGKPGIQVPSPAADTAWWLYTVRVAPAMRSKVRQSLHDSGIGTSILFPLVTATSAYFDPARHAATPVAHAAAAGIFSLPLLADMTPAEFEIVQRGLEVASERLCGSEELR